jgi:hypothetical protein
MSLDREYAGLLGFPTRIPEKLKAIREHLGLTPDQLAPQVEAKMGQRSLPMRTTNSIFL